MNGIHVWHNQVLEIVVMYCVWSIYDKAMNGMTACKLIYDVTFQLCIVYDIIEYGNGYCYI